MKIDDESIMTFDAKGESTIKINTLEEIIESAIISIYNLVRQHT
jgi:hypothetical protein